MTYKLLNKGGIHLVTLEDGTNIPCQVSATMQAIKDACEVTVKALFDERLGLKEDPKLRIICGVLRYGKYTLDNVEILEMTTGKKEDIGTITFKLKAELPDTVDQPKPYAE